MKKLKLTLEDLQVESFETSSERQDAEGTVNGNGVTVEGTCDVTCDDRALCDNNTGGCEPNTSGDAIQCGCWTESWACKTWQPCTEYGFCATDRPQACGA